jgi:hypothetical protein
LSIIQYSDQNTTFWSLDVLPSSRGKVAKRHLYNWIHWKKVISVTAPVIYPEEEATYCSQTVVNIGQTILYHITADRKAHMKPLERR